MGESRTGIVMPLSLRNTLKAAGSVAKSAVTLLSSSRIGGIMKIMDPKGMLEAVGGIIFNVLGPTGKVTTGAIKPTAVRVGGYDIGSSTTMGNLAYSMREMYPKGAVKEKMSEMPLSQGYLIVDSEKCSGCQECMIFCSLVHEGKINPDLARVQVIQNPHGEYPYDLDVYQCRQCKYPVCFEPCPTKAFYVDTENGDIRTIAEERCIGCKLCIEACPYIPHRIVWNYEKNVAMMCDLCAQAPYFEEYFGEKGGPFGKQACVEACPMECLKVVREAPQQQGTIGYDVNLRGKNWLLDREVKK